MATIHRPVHPHARRLRQHVFTAAIAWVEQIFVFKLIQRGTVKRMALALVYHFAVPLQAECRQSVQNMASGTGHFARRIEVFHAQQPAPTVRTGIQKRGHGGEQRADVQQTRGAWGETANIRWRYRHKQMDSGSLNTGRIGYNGGHFTSNRAA